MAIGVVALVAFPRLLRADSLFLAAGWGIAVVDSNDGTTRAFLERPAVHHLVASPDGAHLYATVVGTDERLLAIDPASGEVEAEVVLPGFPHAISLSHDGTALWVRWTRDVPGFSVFDAPTLLPFGTGGASRRAGRVAAGSDGSIGYFVEIGLGGSVVAVDAATLEEVGRAGALYEANGRLAVHPNGRSVYNLGWEFAPFVQVTEFDPEAPSGAHFASIHPMGPSGPAGSFSDIVFRADGERAFVTHQSGSIVVLDTSIPLAPTVQRVVGGSDFSPILVAISVDEEELFLTGRADDMPAIAVLDLRTDRIVRTLALDGPVGTIVNLENETDAPADYSGSGGCQIGSSGPPNAFPLVGWLLLGAMRRRRRKHSRFYDEH